MGSINENLSESESMKKALLLIQRLKSSGLDKESIYARLEKQGIPDNIARGAFKDINLEIKRTVVKVAKWDFKIAIIRIGIGIGAAILSMIILPGIVVIPVGLIAGGVIYALIAKNKME